MTEATLAYQTLDTPDGAFTVVERAGMLIAAGWSDDAVAVARRAGAEPGSAAALASADAVRAWYSGDAAALAPVRIEQRGTAFQTEVWDALRLIPAGEVRRYGQLADAMGKPGASRAVGAACGRNAVALFVPCHRVVGASGALTGFAWGVNVKRSLLAREGAAV